MILYNDALINNALQNKIGWVKKCRHAKKLSEVLAPGIMDQVHATLFLVLNVIVKPKKNACLGYLKTLQSKNILTGRSEMNTRI